MYRARRMKPLAKGSLDGGLKEGTSEGFTLGDHDRESGAAEITAVFGAPAIPFDIPLGLIHRQYVRNRQW